MNHGCEDSAASRDRPVKAAVSDRLVLTAPAAHAILCTGEAMARTIGLRSGNGRGAAWIAWARPWALAAALLADNALAETPTEAAQRLQQLTAERQAALAAGDPTRAERLANEQISLAQQLDDPRELARARAALGELWRRQGRIDDAQVLLESVLPVLRAGDDRRLLVQALSSLAQLRKNRGHYYEALDLESESLALRRAMQPPERPHLSLINLAALYEQMEDFDRALVLQYEALAAARETGDAGSEATAMTRLAGLLNDLRPQQPDEARGYASLALATQQRLGNRPGVLDARFHVGRAELNAGRLDEAERMFDLAWEDALALQQRASQAHIQFRRADLALARGDPALARRMIRDAIARYAELGNRHRLAKAYGLLAQIEAITGDRDAELRARVEHYRLRDELLGAGATRRVNDLADRFRQSSEQARIDVLERDNRIQQLELAQRQVVQWAGSAVLLLALALLALLATRYRGSLAKNRVLRAQSATLAEQRQALSEANHRLAEQAEVLRRLAEEDGLTGLPNRGRGIALLQESLALARAGGGELGVLIIDIDHFKPINDQHGHLTGDVVLRQVANRLAATIDRHGHCARLGGEEFLGVVLPPADPAALAEALRGDIAGLRISLDGGLQLQLTVSIGLVRLAELRNADLPELLRAADQALYAAKRGGRNRLVCWPPPAGGKVVELHA